MHLIGCLSLCRLVVFFWSFYIFFHLGHFFVLAHLSDIKFLSHTFVTSKLRKCYFGLLTAMLIWINIEGIPIFFLLLITGLPGWMLIHFLPKSFKLNILIRTYLVYHLSLVLLRCRILFQSSHSVFSFIIWWIFNDVFAQFSSLRLLLCMFYFHGLSPITIFCHHSSLLDGRPSWILLPFLASPSK